MALQYAITEKRDLHVYTFNGKKHLKAVYNVSIRPDFLFVDLRTLLLQFSILEKKQILKLFLYFIHRLKILFVSMKKNIFEVLSVYF